MTLPALITKQDEFELVRDQIAVIINDNQAAQVILAAGEPDPTLWKLRVFTERANPWELFLNDLSDRSPIVNVWYESGTFDQSKGNTIERQAHAGVFNVDVYGLGVAEDVVAGGHLAGDKEAALAAQRGLRFVRNFLMAGENAYLQKRGVIWQRWVQSITAFQPEMSSESSHQVVAMRLALRVEFNEFAPQVVAADTLNEIGVDIKRQSDGMLIAEADFVFP